MRSMRSAQRQVELRRLDDGQQYQLHPLAVGKILTPAFYAFRPLCPAFSFADVDTYVVD